MIKSVDDNVYNVVCTTTFLTKVCSSRWENYCLRCISPVQNYQYKDYFTKVCGNIKRSVCWENMWPNTFPELRLCQSVWENQRLKRKGRFSRTLLGHGRIVCTNNCGQISKKTGEQIKKLTFKRRRFAVFRCVQNVVDDVGFPPWHCIF